MAKCSCKAQPHLSLTFRVVEIVSFWHPAIPEILERIIFLLPKDGKHLLKLALNRQDKKTPHS